MTNFPRELGDEMESYVEARESPGNVSPASNKLFKNDVANALRWASIALIGVFIASVISVILPIQLFRPEWQDKLIGSIRGGASFPLVGAGLLLIGRHIDSSSSNAWMRLTQQVRALAILASLGFLLLIPLQAYGLWGQAQAEDQQDRISIDRLAGSTKAIAAANGEQALREAIGGLPGAAALANAPLQDPPEQVTRRLLAELTPQINQLKLKLGQRRRARLRRLLRPMTTSSVVSVSPTAALR